MEKEVNEFEKFERYLLAEYDHIAQAHFKTIETISEFFKNYLTIVSIPITFIAIAANLEPIQDNFGVFFSPGQKSDIGSFVSIIPIIFGFIGFMVLWYILNLRCDALLYARTINGIRKFFYDAPNSLTLLDRERIKVLPQSPLLPNYIEWRFFGPVIFTFAIFNTFFIHIGTYGLFSIQGWTNPSQIFVFRAIFPFSLLSHLILYLLLTNFREYGIQRFPIMGIDIDGVLNFHRTQFVDFYKKQTGKELDANQITKIPVRECTDLKISEEEEIAVFNEPEYWTTMPVDQIAQKIIKKIRNSYKIRIHIFTSRSWPVFSTNDKEYQIHTSQKWERIEKDFTRSVYECFSNFELIKIKAKQFIRSLNYISYYFWSPFVNKKSIEKITKSWLDKYGIEFDRLIVEKGSEEASDPHSHVYNRFHASRSMPIKYFVEDDLRKAKKLAYICDIVFLIDQPYNQDSDLPKNVIRVESWIDLLSVLRDVA